jgi:hypothetical protein
VLDKTGVLVANPHPPLSRVGSATASTLRRETRQPEHERRERSRLWRQRLRTDDPGQLERVARTFQISEQQQRKEVSRLTADQEYRRVSSEVCGAWA